MVMGHAVNKLCIINKKYSSPSRGYVYDVADGVCLLKCRLSMGCDGAAAQSQPIASCIMLVIVQV
jgi:hypothetical protein